MSSPAAFRKAALALNGATESAHMGHPDFRVGGRIFASLGYPDAGSGMVKLSPEEQEWFMQAEPEAFARASGAWGARGSTIVNLRAVSAASLRNAIRAAWERTNGA